MAAAGDGECAVPGGACIFAFPARGADLAACAGRVVLRGAASVGDRLEAAGCLDR